MNVKSSLVVVSVLLLHRGYFWEIFRPKRRPRFPSLPFPATATRHRSRRRTMRTRWTRITWSGSWARRVSWRWQGASMTRSTRRISTHPSTTAFWSDGGGGRVGRVLWVWGGGVGTFVCDCRHFDVASAFADRCCTMLTSFGARGIFHARHLPTFLCRRVRWRARAAIQWALVSAISGCQTAPLLPGNAPRRRLPQRRRRVTRWRWRVTRRRWRATRPLMLPPEESRSCILLPSWGQLRRCLVALGRCLAPRGRRGPTATASRQR